MTQQYDLKAMVTKIRALRRNAEALKALGAAIPAVVKNTDRILADVRLLEIDISEVAEALAKQR